MTATTTSTNPGGMWLSLNHPEHEKLAINFSAILPSQILPQHQSKITGLTIRVAGATPARTFKVELKDDTIIRWSQSVLLSGGTQTLSFDLPHTLTDVTTLVWLIEPITSGEYAVVEHVAFTATTSMTDAARAGFGWSYGMLLRNLNPDTGLVRDAAKYASGEFDAIQSTGSLAAATVVAEQSGVINYSDAMQIVNQISHTLLISVPRYHGLWPHWVEQISGTNEITIAQNTEWSSVDTVIAALALLDAQNALGLDTSGTEQLLQGIDWDDLLTSNGISHGYTYTGAKSVYVWDTFGGESWLVDLAYAAATQKIAPLKYPAPPTANGSGFIDELAWLFVPPPQTTDYWGVDWALYRRQASYTQTLYYPSYYPASCLDQLGLFGLSAAEVPVPSAVITPEIYQAFGVGGRSDGPHDGSSLLTAPVAVPHYAAMMASPRPTEAISMWTWLINAGPFSPLNNVESLLFSAGASCDAAEMKWNHLKGSWNLALQTLGWGRYLIQRQGQDFGLWQAARENKFLREGYALLVPNRLYLPVVLKN
ncbi:MAG: hypothetical protein JW953_05545 [Anaerolineae bacterium]|nr:hypothetical protein [Anaerolineae bacterium]